MSGQTIVICRPIEDSAELAAAVTASGFKPLIEPVLDIKYLQADFSEISESMPLVFTSANGVKAFSRGSDLRANPVYTVGRNTADEARQAGFTRIETAAGTVDDLVDILLKACAEGGDVLYVRGEEVSKDLKSLLAKGGVNVRELTAYRSVPAGNLSLGLLKALDSKEIAAFLFFSVKGAGVFADLVEQYGRAHKIRTTKALCIGEAVLKSVSVLPFGGSLVADTPDRYGMIKLLEQLKD
jgi:uroporphyrinogen-III synthase